MKATTAKVASDFQEAFETEGSHAKPRQPTARARHPAATVGTTPANKPGGSPTTPIAWSLQISVSIDSRGRSPAPT
jgi:hypothetical protein